jgi:predicted dehydrogenase
MGVRPRVALFGHGAMGRRHATALDGIADLVIVDPVEGVDAWTGTVDAAIIAVPAALHAGVAAPLLHAGVPCLVEKPLATTLDDADQLATFARAWVGHVERFNPAFLALREAARDHDWRHADFVREGPRPERGVDLDAALDLLVHDLDLLATLAPGDPVVALEARAHPAPGLARHEGIAVAVTLASGRTAALRAGRGVATGRRDLLLSNAPRVLGAEGARPLRNASPDAGSPPSTRVAPELRADFLARGAWQGGAPLAVADTDALRAQDLAFLALARGESVVGALPATAEEGRDAVALALRAMHLRDRRSPP